MATLAMLSSVTARWIRTEISARLAAMTLVKGGGGSLSAVICWGLTAGAAGPSSSPDDLTSVGSASTGREEEVCCHDDDDVMEARREDGTNATPVLGAPRAVRAATIAACRPTMPVVVLLTSWLCEQLVH